VGQSKHPALSRGSHHIDWPGIREEATPRHTLRRTSPPSSIHRCGLPATRGPSSVLAHRDLRPSGYLPAETQEKELDDVPEAHRCHHRRPDGVVAMITVIIAGLGFLVVAAIIVGIVDAAQASRWRQIAAERREKWEARQPQLHGIDPYAGYHPDDGYDPPRDDD
jgi:hypothetical protein